MNDEQLLYAAYLEKKEKARNEKSFPEQDRFVDDLSLFVAACCTRRAGKSNGLGLRFYKQMKKYPGSLSRYIALTRDSAKDIMWPALQELNETYGWNAEFIENPLTMILPNGSRLRLIGADMKNFIARLRGAKTVANAIDEAQSFGSHIENLVNDVIVPTMADYTDAWLAVTGTPGPIPRGFFYDLSTQGVGEYSVHEWSLFNNPYLPNAREFVEKLKARQKWDDNNPTYQREWLGKWVLDIESLLLKYDEAKSHFDEIPNARWNYILGVDLGLRDSDALAVLAWSESNPNVYLVEEIATREQDITSLVGEINLLLRKYDISKIVMDTGGLGAKIAEEIIRRHHIPIKAADKKRKMENVAFLNDWLRLGRFKAKKDSKFAQDSYQVQIDYEKTTPDHLVVKKSFHSDIIDAVLYAFKESPAFTYQAPAPDKPKWGTPEWAKEEESEMERAAIDYFTREEKTEWGY